MQRVLVCVVLLSLAGCAGAESKESVALAEPSGGTAEKRYRSERKPLSGTTADPYRKRPGGQTTKTEDDDPGTVQFKEPETWPTPVKVAKRPAIPHPSKLAVALVRRGEIQFKAKLVLELESLLSRDKALKLVMALKAPRERQVTLKTLATQAHKEGRELLLVDVRPGLAGRVRDGYLLLAKDGTLLAAYRIKKGSKPPPPRAATDGHTPDVCQRIGAAYARLKK